MKLGFYGCLHNLRAASIFQMSGHMGGQQFDLRHTLGEGERFEKLPFSVHNNSVPGAFDHSGGVLYC